MISHRRYAPLRNFFTQSQEWWCAYNDSFRLPV